ncbi:MAG: aldolase/citrate lyase family protein [Chloroflexi bacterium]|nr:aldolase/citrate lyase family protein [Chloroflexota bacterium]
MKENRLRQMLDAGQVPVGTVVFEFATPGIGRLAHEAGADFVMLDMEHTGWSFETVKSVIAATRSVPIAVMVRVPAASYEYVAKALDIGAQAVSVPMVESREQAEIVAQAARYAPDGRRGTGFGIAHDDYTDGDVTAKMQAANRSVLATVIIETEKGVENADAIASTPGIDVVWIGQFDLTASQGIPGQFGNSKYLAAVDKVMQACKGNKKVCGIMVPKPEDTATIVKQGFRALMYSVDTAIYKNTLRSGLDAIRKHTQNA